jgi:MYXO-CTERM domain-containing protein
MGLIDGTELSVVSPPAGTSTAGLFVADADRDTFTNPTIADTDGDTILDGIEDANHNGRVDDGESDPNDPSDPVIPCPNGDECPGTLECFEGVCRVPVPVDGGLMCMTLAERMIECCTACTGGTPMTPVCPAQGALEMCPAGSVQCLIGSCTGDGPDGPGGDEGCACSSVEERGGAPWLLGLIVLAMFAGRRRRGA